MSLKDIEQFIEQESKEGGEKVEVVNDSIGNESVLEKCIHFVDYTVCEGDKVRVLLGRYWVEGEVIKTSKFGIVVKNPVKEHIIRLGKIAMIIVLQRGDVYKKYSEISK